MMQLGIGEANITPPFDVEIGGWLFGRSKGVLDELFAQVFLWETSSSRTAVISLDIVGISAEETEKLRYLLRTRCGIDHALINCSHSHSAPTGVDFAGGWGKTDTRYMAFMQERVLEAAFEACAGIFSARIGIASGEGRDLSHCPPHRNAIGCIDPEIGVIRVDDMDGKLRGLLVNFACHPVCLHGYKALLSADFPGAMRREIKNEMGGDVTVGYLQGAQGDIMPLGFKGASNGEPALAQEIGEKLAGHVQAIATQIETDPLAPPVVMSERVRLPLVPLASEEELEKEIAELSSKIAAETNIHRKDVYEVDCEWAIRMLACQKRGGVENTLDVELQAIALSGSDVLLAVPFELYADLGMRIKEASPFERTYIAGVSNGDFGYVANRETHEAGTYTVTHACKRMGTRILAPQLADHLIVSAADLLNQVHRPDRSRVVRSTTVG